MLSFSYLEVSSADEDLGAVLLLLRTVVFWLCIYFFVLRCPYFALGFELIIRGNVVNIFTHFDW